MAKKLLFIALTSLLLTAPLTAHSDDYDDCKSACNQALDPCVEQAKLNAGNIQEQEDQIAACRKKEQDCIKGCSDSEAAPQASPQEQGREQQQDSGNSQ